jgi:septal ring factor EnvC (AmiA/AmiB activator)
MNDVNHKNIVAVFDHSKKNQHDIEELEETVAALWQTIRILNERIDQQQSQIATLQVTLFSGRATHGNIH